MLKIAIISGGMSTSEERPKVGRSMGKMPRVAKF